MDSVKVPRPEERESGPVRYLEMASTGLAFFAALIGVITQVIRHFQRPRAGAGTRTKLDTAMLGLSITKALPGIIRTAKTLKADISKVKPNR